MQTGASHQSPTTPITVSTLPAPAPRIGIVPTGILIPRAVLAAQEMRFTSLADLDLSKSQAGVYHDSIGNCRVIMEATLNGRLWFNTASSQHMRGGRELEDEDAFHETAVVNAMPGGHSIKDRTMLKAMQLVAKHNPFDPWREWLSGLVWDGTERLNSMAEDYFGVSVGADGLERIIMRKLMIAVVARQFRPGSKFDSMVVLEGAQGTRKSSALRTLFGDPYVASWEHDVNSKDFRQQLQGNVCIEVSELASFARSELNAIKSILSETTDVYRPSYGRSVKRHPRRCVLVGTSNDRSYLTDSTGNRRFWPLACDGVIQIDSIESVREQLFAEAVAAFRAGGADARWWELPARVVQEQAARLIPDPWTEIIRRHLISAGDRVNSADLLHRPLEIPKRDRHPGNLRRVAGVLRVLGWTQGSSGTDRRWRRPGTESQPDADA
jgi:predicted P-loop ATPase